MGKKFNLETGKQGEDLAVKFLRKKGYRILARNFKTKYAEIDLVAKKKKTLIFGEVKTRKGENFGSPEEAIDKRKKNRLKRAAQAFVAFHHWEGPFQIDALCLVLDREGKLIRFRHYQNITA